MGRLITFVSIVLLMSCASQKKKANQYFDSNRGELAEKCQKEFPNDTIKIIKGETKTITDTITIQGVIIPCPEPTTENPKPVVKCPDSKTITITKERTDTILITDMQKIKSLEHNLKEAINKYQEQEKKLNNCNSKKDTYLWIIIILGLAVILYIYLIARRI